MLEPPLNMSTPDPNLAPGAQPRPAETASTPANAPPTNMTEYLSGELSAALHHLSHIEKLPIEVVCEIAKFLTWKQIGNLRLASRQMAEKASLSFASYLSILPVRFTLSNTGALCHLLRSPTNANAIRELDIIVGTSPFPKKFRFPEGSYRDFLLLSLQHKQESEDAGSGEAGAEEEQDHAAAAHEKEKMAKLARDIYRGRIPGYMMDKYSKVCCLVGCAHHFLALALINMEKLQAINVFGTTIEIRHLTCDPMACASIPLNHRSLSGILEAIHRSKREVQRFEIRENPWLHGTKAGYHEYVEDITPCRRMVPKLKVDALGAVRELAFSFAGGGHNKSGK